MKSFQCPKCGGNDYFLSKRNIVNGMGWAQRGSVKSVPVCRACDEIMMSFHSNKTTVNRVNKIGKYGLISTAVILALILLIGLLLS
jgi:hypothetical protein